MTSTPSTVILRRFADTIEAEAIRGRLALEGIDALISGTDNAAAFGMGGAPFANGIRLEVFPQDFHRAQELLVHDHQRLLSAGDWECPRCNEPNEPAFEVCWSCQKKRPDDSEGGLRGGEQHSGHPNTPQAHDPPILADSISEGTPFSENAGPYRPILLPSEPPSSQTQLPTHQEEDLHGDIELLEAEIRRLWLLCGVAIVGLPLMLSLYALYRIVRTERKARSTTGYRGKLWTLFAIHLVLLSASILYWASMLSWMI